MKDERRGLFECWRLSRVRCGSLHDNDWFRGQVARFEPRVIDIHSGNPPTMGLLVLPVAWADYRLARGIWIAATLLLVIGAAGRLVRSERLGGFWAPAFLCIVLFAYPIRENISHAQVYGLAFALLAISSHGYRTSRDGLLGVPLGILLVNENRESDAVATAAH